MSDTKKMCYAIYHDQRILYPECGISHLYLTELSHTKIRHMGIRMPAMFIEYHWN